MTQILLQTLLFALLLVLTSGLVKLASMVVSAPNSSYAAALFYTGFCAAVQILALIFGFELNIRTIVGRLPEIDYQTVALLIGAGVLNLWVATRLFEVSWLRAWILIICTNVMAILLGKGAAVSLAFLLKGS